MLHVRSVHLEHNLASFFPWTEMVANVTSSVTTALSTRRSRRVAWGRTEARGSKILLMPTACGFSPSLTPTPGEHRPSLSPESSPSLWKGTCRWSVGRWVAVLVMGVSVCCPHDLNHLHCGRRHAGIIMQQVNHLVMWVSVCCPHDLNHLHCGRRHVDIVMQQVNHLPYVHSGPLLSHLKLSVVLGAVCR